ncbi:MAG: hypothetical protein IJY33_03170 [Oscillospiraceae bacterium]|nr:hypothetical protein [Oscillospiraceae bacterium]
MTEKLYLNDSYVKEFTALVLSCTKNGENYEVILDRTAFFPEGGGQSADKGEIGGIEVLDVQERGEDVVHTTALPVSGEVECKIDWALRFVRMQNHCAEHILSGVIHKMFGYNNVGFHMNDSLITFDVDGPLTAEDIERVEKDANKAVFQNAEITVSYPTADEFEKIDCRSKIELTDGVRLITVAGFDTCACCAPHPMRAGEIGLIKIVNFSAFKGGTRIEMVAGSLALSDYAYLHNCAKAIMKQLSAKREEIAEQVQKLGEDLGSAKAEIKALNEKLAEASLNTAMVGNTLVGFTKDADFNALRNIANGKINDAEYIALFAETADGFNYLVASKEGDTRSFAKALNENFSGKGGGRPDCVQGKIAKTDKQSLMDILK